MKLAENGLKSGLEEKRFRGVGGELLDSFLQGGDFVGVLGGEVF